MDVVNSVYAINDFLAQGWDGSNNEIDLVTKTVEPRGDEKELAEITDLIGSYTTNFASSSAGRAKKCHNRSEQSRWYNPLSGRGV